MVASPPFSMMDVSHGNETSDEIIDGSAFSYVTKVCSCLSFSCFYLSIHTMIQTDRHIDRGTYISHFNLSMGRNREVNWKIDE